MDDHEICLVIWMRRVSVKFIFRRNTLHMQDQILVSDCIMETLEMEVGIIVLLSFIVIYTPDFSFIMLVNWLDCFLFMKAEFGCPRYSASGSSKYCVRDVLLDVFILPTPLFSYTPSWSPGLCLRRIFRKLFFSDLYAFHQAAIAASKDTGRSSVWEICSSGATSRMREIWHGMFWTWVYMCAQFRHLGCLSFSLTRWYPLLDLKSIKMYLVI